MKIAMMVRGYLPVPRPEDMVYAPIDLAVAIAEGLTARGHKVDFFAPMGSRLPNSRMHLETLNLRPLAHNQKEFGALLGDTDKLSHYMPAAWDWHFASEMFDRAVRGQYDVLHFHHPEAGLMLAKAHPEISVVHTMHDPVSPWYREMFELYQTLNQQFISISNNQRRDAPDLPYLSTVYNGVDVDSFAFSDQAEDYLLYVGRIVPDKGVKEAVQIALQTGSRLLIIGPVYPDHQEYFDQYVKPHLNDKILYLGYMGRENIVKYYQKAKALLTPVQWEEPFGLTTVEAMACGTPAISLHRGAAPELIVDGKTGFVVSSVGEMVAAVGKLHTIKRSACRRQVQEHFSLDKMVDGYEAAFASVIAARNPLTRGKRLVGEQLRRLTAKAKS